MYTHFGYAYEEKQVTYNERLAMSLSAVCIDRSSEVDALVTKSFTTHTEVSTPTTYLMSGARENTSPSIELPP